MPNERAWSTSRKVTSSPFTTMRPSSAFWKPAMIFISVDLPAPLSPSSPSTSPLRRWRLTSRRAVTAPNRFETCSMRRTSSATGVSAMTTPLPDAADVDVDAHREQDRDTEDEVEVVGAHALECQAVAQHTQEQGTEQCADHRALPTGEQRASDDGCRHGT